MIDHIYQNPEFGEEWFSYPNLYKSMVEKFSSGSKFVEIGSWKGKSSAYMAVEIANSNKDIDFYCVDTWEGSIEHKNNTEISMLYDIFLNNMKPVESYYTPLKMKSLDAVSRFGDHSLDFVFIDGSHEYEDVKEDIKAWLPKVKPGGILAGHDYYIKGTDWFPGVKRAVNEELSGFETSENCWIYTVPSEVTIEEKLKNFPSVNFISIEESEDRRKVLYQQFEKYGITNITPHIYKRYRDEDHKIIEGPLVNHNGKGPVTSHLKAIKEWYENTDEPYTFFCEDDFSFDTVKYWNFTWTEFIENLPEDWDSIQLMCASENSDNVRLRRRTWDDFSVGAYIVSRKFAKVLIDTFIKDGKFLLEFPGNLDWVPLAEHLIYYTPKSVIDSQDLQYNVFVLPLFVEEIKFTTTFFDRKSKYWGEDTGVYKETHKGHHIDSYQKVLNWWKTIGKTLTIEEIMNL